MLIILTILISSTYSQGINPGGTSLQTYSPTSLQTHSPTPLSSYSPTSLQTHSPTSLQTHSPTPLPSYSPTSYTTIKITQTSYPSIIKSHNQSISSFTYQNISLSHSITSSISSSSSPSASYSPTSPSISYSPTSPSISYSPTFTQSYSISPSIIQVSLSTPTKNPLINSNNNSPDNIYNMNYIIGGSLIGGFIILLIILNLCCKKKPDTILLSNSLNNPRVAPNMINHNPISAIIPPLTQIHINNGGEWKKYSDGNDVWYVSSEGVSSWTLPKGAKILI